ncbi:uncharacterized protein LOC122196838 [Lactuca sativa]|uniref:uncharacterized protein LOC122196838 n=1 Tax=Lactuca sativa TaxID=4236 RepID=UPI0022AEE870|nr:uncharacterized protein LOC122196838 [Lactuca sativa]
MLGAGLQHGRSSGGEDRFYMPAKARRIRQHQENLRRAQSNVTPPQSTTSSVREESENQLMQPSNPEPLESSVVAVPATSSLCNLERFLETVTPSVPVQHLSKRTMRGWRTSDVEYQPYFVLGDLWESFKEWSAYGVGVPLILNEANCVIQYYVPYLSGIQIYVDHLKSSINSRQLTEDIDDNSFTDSSSDGSSDYEQEKGSLHYLREKSNNHHPKNDILHRMDHFSMNDENNVVQEDFSSDDSDSATTQSCSIFEYMEHSQPLGREPLCDKILDLAQRFPELKSLRSCDLLPSSWLSVAWYPIYRIPMGPTLKDLDACFLTFHSLHTPTTGNECEHPLVVRHFSGTGVVSLPAFGLASYKLRGTTGLPGPMGLMSTSHLEQEAAVLALSTLMTIAPAQVYAEFEKLGNGGLFGASYIQVKDFPSLILMFGNNLVERTYESDINGTKFNTRIHTIRC